MGRKSRRPQGRIKVFGDRGQLSDKDIEDIVAAKLTVEGVELEAPGKKHHPSVRRGRPRGSGTFGRSDGPLIQKMQVLLHTGKARSPHDAARQVADQAEGGATFESKVRRLTERYKQTLERK